MSPDTPTVGHVDKKSGLVLPAHLEAEREVQEVHAARDAARDELARALDAFCKAHDMTSREVAFGILTHGLNRKTTRAVAHALRWKQAKATRA